MEDVEVKEFDLDNSSWAWGTLLNMVPHLLKAEENPGRDEVMEVVFKLIMEDAASCDLTTAFGNPVTFVTAQRPSDLFFQEARRAQANWFSQAQDVFGSSGRVKRAVKEMSPVIRQLSHTGVLIVDGKHVLPNLWPDRPKRSNLVGQRFRRLVVVQMLKGRSCRCQCDCGQETIVRRSHLVKGSTGSCGCLKAEFEARKKQRKSRKQNNE